jgi:hypothetical protein
VGENSWNGYEHSCLFTNRNADRSGDGTFLDTARPLGVDGTADGRGVAVADFDGDGRLDLVIQNNAAAPTLYLNRLAAPAAWLGIDLEGRHGNRDAVGARVRLRLTDGWTLTRWVEAGGGYASQSSYRVHFGLGTPAPTEGISEVEVTWPGGRVESWSGNALEGWNRVLSLQEGLGSEAGTEAAGTP